MSKIHRNKGVCPKCGSSAIRYKHGQKKKAKGWSIERCTSCGHYIRKN